MTTTSKIALGIVGAAAAGVVIGLLLAPEKGADMRKKIKKTAGDWADSLGHLFAKGEEELENLKEKGRAFKSKAETKANEMKESFS
ncbi:MAG TPA: YtxH domain-containing protein [Chitinophagaceae bacterium]|nr:YtxH domain-containing protein [Chitinophagaceae bacterium]